jgi:hypothetical protein
MMQENDMALDEFKKQCEGKFSRIGSKDGTVVLVKEVFHNPERSLHIDAIVKNDDGSEIVLPVISLFAV